MKIWEAGRVRWQRTKSANSLYDSCPNTAGHSCQEGQIFTEVMYYQYVRMGWYDAGWGGELEDNIDVIGGE